jgi:hypothetical protein
MRISKKEQIEQMTSLTIEQKKELCTYLGRAQSRNADYAIECDGDDAAALLNWWQQHQVETAKRAARKKSRPERQQQSLSEQCETVISELADVYNVTVKEVIKQLQAKIETVREQEQQKAFDAERAAVEKIKAFKAAHPEFIAEWEQLQTEQQKQAIRCSKLSTQIAQAKYEQRRRGRSKSEDVKSVALF